MNTKPEAATRLAHAMLASGVSIEALSKALEKARAALASPKPVIASQAEAEAVPPGKYRVKRVEGLYLKKGAPGAGSWFRRYWFDGKRREMGLGALAEVSLALAIKKAREFDGDRARGVDPLTLKRAAKAEAAEAARAAAIAADRWSFAQATESYLSAHAASWKHPRARQVWFSPIVKYAYPIIGPMSLDAIRVEHVAAVMTAAAHGGAPKVAPRIRLRIEQIVNAATALGRRNAELVNPASVKLIKAVRPTRQDNERKHFRRIALADAPAAFAKLAALAGDSAPLSALMFAILTATRPGEALNARWREIDLRRRLWTVPGERMKSGKEHVVPLSLLALAVIERQARVRVSDAVFPGAGHAPMSYGAFSAATRKIDFDLGAPHSWRSIFRDWAGEHGGIARETAEAALAHSLGAVEAAYRRETGVAARAVAMQRYADWLVAGGEGAVVAFPARA
jgi:integrase